MNILEWCKGWIVDVNVEILLIFAQLSWSIVKAIENTFYKYWAFPLQVHEFSASASSNWEWTLNLGDTHARGYIFLASSFLRTILTYIQLLTWILWNFRKSELQLPTSFKPLIKWPLIGYSLLPLFLSSIILLIISVSLPKNLNVTKSLFQECFWRKPN
jgi:hypothetical protein